jgi:hypothetical protein
VAAGRATDLLPEDAQLRFSRATAADYWRSLDDTLHVEALELDDAELDDTESRDAGELASDLKERLRVDGFFVRPPDVDDERLSRARAAVDAVARAGWPRVFAFVYDEIWRVVRAPGVVSLTRALLGADARQLPGIWAHHVAADAGARGWGPHVDTRGTARTAQDGAPARLTVWLPLTDATLDNGCMRAVPVRLTGDLAERFEDLERAERHEWLTWLQNARALPAPAGSVLGWRTDVLHFGGVSTGRAPGPRLALSLELGHEDAPPTLEERPFVFTRGAVPFALRLAFIGHSLLAYGKAAEREPDAVAFVSLGDPLRALLDQ